MHGSLVEDNETTSQHPHNVQACESVRWETVVGVVERQKAMMMECGRRKLEGCETVETGM
jgi:hypothetical protein